MTASTMQIGLEVAVKGTPQAVSDLGLVDAALKGVGSASAAAGAAGRQGADSAKAAWNEHKATAAGAKASVESLAASLGKIQAAAGQGNLKTQRAEIDRLAKSCGLSATSIEGMIRQMEQVRKARAFADLREEARLSMLQLARLQAGMGDLSGAFGTVAHGVAAAKFAIAGFAAAALLAVKSGVDASLQTDRLSKAYSSISGSAQGASVQLEYIYEVSDRLGLQFQSTAASAKTFFAAGKNSSLERDLNGIFEAVSSAGAALVLSQDDIQGAFLALGQMISKGKVQAEELRGQLGERLPGAFQAAARALGMTTAELDKFMADGKLTAEDLLPKLARVLKEDFGDAAVLAAQGLQGQLNRLSTEWTRVKAGFVDSEAIAGVVSSLASAMKTLADNAGTIASVAGAAAEWAAWSAAAYALGKSLLMTRDALVAVRAASMALSFSSLVAGAASFAAALGPVGVAAAVGLAVVAVGKLIDSTESADEVFKRYQSTIDEYKRKMGEAAQAAENFAKTQTETYRKSLQRQLELTQTDIAAAAAGVNGALSGIRAPGMDNMLSLYSGRESPLLQARDEVNALGKELAALGASISKQDLEAYRAKVLSVDERVRAAGMATKEWNAALTGLIGEGDSFVLKLAAMIEKGASLKDALWMLEQQSETAKASLSTGWTLNVEDVTKGIAAMEKEIRGMEAELAGFKSSKALVNLLPDIPVETIAEVKKAFGKDGLEGALRAVGDAAEAWGVEQRLAFNDALDASKRLDETTARVEAFRKVQKEAAKDHTASRNQMTRNEESYRAEVDQTAASVKALQAQLATAPGEVFSREQAKILAEYESSLAKIRKELAAYTTKKGVSPAQAEELAAQKEVEAGLRRDLSLRQALEAEESRLAGTARDKYEFYKELEEMSGRYGLSIKYQNEMIKAQVKELEKLDIPPEYIRQWRELKELQASHDWVDGAKRGLIEYQAAASDAAKGTEAAFSGLFQGLDRGFENMWAGMIENGKASFSSFKSLFSSFLAQIMNMTITRPIVVRIAGVVSGMLGTSGTAAAMGGAEGSGASGGFGSLFGNIPFSSLLPNSWTSGLGGLMGYTLPGTSIPGLVGPTTSGAALGGGLTLGAAGLYGGLGGLGYSLLGGALGLPQNKYTGITSSLGGTLGAWGGSALGATMAASGAVTGAMAGSVFPVVGTIIGAVAGGLLGGLFGKKKKKPAVWTGVGVDLASGSYSVDSVGRNGVGGDTESAIEAAFGQAIQGALDTAKALTEALPEKYSKELQSKLGGFSTSYEWKGGDIDEEHIKEAAQNLQDRVYESLLASFRQVDFSGSGLNVDTSGIAGMQKAISAFQAWDEMEKTMNAVLEPVPILTQTVTGANEQMDAWIKNLKELGWKEEKLAEIEAKRQDYIDGLTFSLRTQFDMEMELREASLKGTQGLVQAQQALWADMQSIAANFGVDSDQAKRWETYQKEYIPKLAEELAKGQYQSELAALQQQAQAFRAVAQQLESLRAGMRVSEQTSPFDVVRRADEAGADYRRTLAAAMGGDLTAAQQLSGLSTTYLSAARAGAASGADYSDVFFGVMADLAAVEKLYGSQLSDADLGLEEQKQSNKTLAEILAEIERLNSEIKDATESNTKTLLDYLAGLVDGTIKTRATGGYTPAGWTLVGERGPELVHFDEPGMVYTAEQTAAVFRAAGAPQQIRTGGEGGGAALRLEITALRRDMARLFDRVERNTRRASDALDKWDGDGLPAPRSDAAAPIRRAR